MEVSEQDTPALDSSNHPCTKLNTVLEEKGRWVKDGCQCRHALCMLRGLLPWLKFSESKEECNTSKTIWKEMGKRIYSDYSQRQSSSANILGDFQIWVKKARVWSHELRFSWTDWRNSLPPGQEGKHVRKVYFHFYYTCHRCSSIIHSADNGIHSQKTHRRCTISKLR